MAYASTVLEWWHRAAGYEQQLICKAVHAWGGRNESLGLKLNLSFLNRYLKAEGFDTLVPQVGTLWYTGSWWGYSRVGTGGGGGCAVPSCAVPGGGGCQGLVLWTLCAAHHHYGLHSILHIACIKND